VYRLLAIAICTRWDFQRFFTSMAIKGHADVPYCMVFNAWSVHTECVWFICRGYTLLSY